MRNYVMDGPTMVRVIGVSPEKGIYYLTNNNVGFYISKYKAGEATLNFSDFTFLPNMISTVVGLFDDKSNLYGFKMVTVTFNGVTLQITKENAIYERIANEYFAKLDVN